MIDLPVGFGDVNGTLVFNEDRLELENVTGRMGGGHVKLGGFITYGRTLGFNLSADGTDIRFRYSGISVTSDQSLRLTGTTAERDADRQYHGHAIRADSVRRFAALFCPRPARRPASRTRNRR